MFKIIKMIPYKYKVIDDDFSDTTYKPGALGIIDVYGRRGLNPLPALKIYYVTYYGKNYSDKNDRYARRVGKLNFDIGKYGDTLGVYRNCIMNYLNIALWAGKR